MKTALKVVAADPNQKGDLLGRLIVDFFYCLGYDDCQLNIPKTGREIDLKARHRHESRQVIAECKATNAPTGGSDINKFVGVLDAERRRNKTLDIRGYFISLAGFTSSARQQEEDLGSTRIVLVEAATLINELVRGRFLISPSKANMIAMREGAGSLSSYTYADRTDLLATSIGWLWLVHLKSATGGGVVLVHADGSIAAAGVAEKLWPDVEVVDPSFSGLYLLNECILPKFDGQQARSEYLSYLVREFGGITLEGLPADRQVGSRRFKLEDLYVPLTLSKADDNEDEIRPSADVDGMFGERVSLRISEQNRSPSLKLGEAITKHLRLAVVGLPGSGKSTIIKRLAVAYAERHRLRESADMLPELPLFPVVIRCRDVTKRARPTILDMIGDQIQRTEIPTARTAFMAMLVNELNAGRVLLLIDGLDEFESGSERVNFVTQLRTFLGTYRTCRIVLTSREAGFRAVAGAVHSLCFTTHVDGLSSASIRALVNHWHDEVVGSTRVVRQEAQRLSRSILTNSRVRILAANPLLLTTLLLVKRWVGQLPRRRSVLYDKAIEVLLMTWNSEGHQPLDTDEALPQLAYAAYVMMDEGATRVTSDELAKLFTSARQDLPEELSYAKMSVHEFIRRVEERSSLMTLGGYVVENGRLRPAYEFKHLTFQEYLAALAVAKGWLPAKIRSRQVIELLEDRFTLAGWEEVVTLAAVLSSRDAPKIVSRLIEIVRNSHSSTPLDQGRREAAPSTAFLNLVGCLRDEAAITPQMAEEAITACNDAIASSDIGVRNLYESLHGGRYDAKTRQLLTLGIESFRQTGSELNTYADGAAVFGQLDMEIAKVSRRSYDQWIMERLCSQEREQVITGAGALMHIGYRRSVYTYPRKRISANIKLSASIGMALDILVDKVDRNSAEALMLAWALGWGLPSEGLDPERRRRALTYLASQLPELTRPDYRHFFSWAIASCMPIDGWRLPKAQASTIVQHARLILRPGPVSYLEHRAAYGILAYLGNSRDRAKVGKLAAKALENPHDLQQDFLRALVEICQSSPRSTMRNEGTNGRADAIE